MGNEITALKDEIEISYLFSEPGRAALYITHPSWRLNKENIINEDQRYVMGPSHFDTDYRHYCRKKLISTTLPRYSHIYSFLLLSFKVLIKKYMIISQKASLQFSDFFIKLCLFFERK